MFNINYGVFSFDKFTKDLRISEYCVSVSNNICRTLVLSLELPFKLDETFTVTLALVFIPDFNLLSCALDNFTFEVLY